jgi:D-sedoheptulose 7-phosphate isomerase
MMPSTCAMSTTLTTARLYTDELQSVINYLDTAVVDRIAETIYQTYLAENTIFVLGNGGSATLATHVACDLGKNVSGGHKRIRAISLTDNVAMLTAWANDLSYESVFAEQLRNFVQPGDLVLAISCSGNSKNVLQAIELGREAGALIVGITGFQGGKMRSLCDDCLVVPSDNMQVIEDLHTVVSHAIATILYNKVFAAANIGGNLAQRSVGEEDRLQRVPVGSRIDQRNLEGDEVDNCAA